MENQKYSELALASQAIIEKLQLLSLEKTKLEEAIRIQKLRELEEQDLTLQNDCVMKSLSQIEQRNDSQITQENTDASFCGRLTDQTRNTQCISREPTIGSTKTVIKDSNKESKHNRSSVVHNAQESSKFKGSYKSFINNYPQNRIHIIQSSVAAAKRKSDVHLSKKESSTKSKQSLRPNSNIAQENKEKQIESIRQQYKQLNNSSQHRNKIEPPVKQGSYSQISQIKKIYQLKKDSKTHQSQAKLTDIKKTGNRKQSKQGAAISEIQTELNTIQGFMLNCNSAQQTHRQSQPFKKSHDMSLTQFSNLQTSQNINAHQNPSYPPPFQAMLRTPVRCLTAMNNTSSTTSTSNTHGCTTPTNQGLKQQSKNIVSSVNQSQSQQSVTDKANLQNKASQVLYTKIACKQESHQESAAQQAEVEVKKTQNYQQQEKEKVLKEASKQYQTLQKFQRDSKSRKQSRSNYNSNQRKKKLEKENSNLKLKTQLNGMFTFNMSRCQHLPLSQSNHTTAKKGKKTIISNLQSAIKTGQKPQIKIEEPQQFDNSNISQKIEKDESLCNIWENMGFDRDQQNLNKISHRKRHGGQ